MDFHLRVVAAFAEHAIGAVITDAEKMAFALAHYSAAVVRIAAPAAEPNEGA